MKTRACVRHSPTLLPPSAHGTTEIRGSALSRPDCSVRGANGTVIRMRNGSRPKQSRPKSWMHTRRRFARRRCCCATRRATTTPRMLQMTGATSAITTIPSLGLRSIRDARTRTGSISHGCAKPDPLRWNVGARRRSAARSGLNSGLFCGRQKGARRGRILRAALAKPTLRGSWTRAHPVRSRLKNGSVPLRRHGVWDTNCRW